MRGSEDDTRYRAELLPSRKGRPRHVGPLRGGMQTAQVLWLILPWAAGLSGCLAPNEISAIRAEMDKLAQDIGVLHVKAETRIHTDGGDVNEPVTGWILAIGYAAVPIAFLLYLVAHRSSLFRIVKDRLRGRR